MWGLELTRELHFRLLFIGGLLPAVGREALCRSAKCPFTPAGDDGIGRSSGVLARWRKETNWPQSEPHKQTMLRNTTQNSLSTIPAFVST